MRSSVMGVLLVVWPPESRMEGAEVLIHVEASPVLSGQSARVTRGFLSWVLRAALGGHSSRRAFSAVVVGGQPRR
jgi:hypothetical protein